MTEAPKRGSMHKARKIRIHAARGGLCGECGLPVDVSGPEVVYDHRRPLWLSLDDSDDNLWPVHKACDQIKTPLDQTTIAKVKRLIKKALPREKPSRLQSRGFGQVHRPFPKSSNRLGRGRSEGHKRAPSTDSRGASADEGEEEIAP